MGPTQNQRKPESDRCDALPAQGNEHRDMFVRLEDAWHQIGDPNLDIRALLHKYADLGADVIRHNPSTFEQTVHQLLDVASYMTPDEAKDFLEHRVSTQTFTFQDRFSELVAPTNLDLSTSFACHINKCSLLLSVPEQVLVPPSILQPRLALNTYEPYNQNHVFFATDQIDRLAQYLVGHALLRPPDKPGAWPQPTCETWEMNLANVWACEPTSQLFSRDFMLAVIQPDYSNPMIKKDIHDVESPVRVSSETITIVLASEPVKVDFLKIPATVLLPHQRDQLEKEASLHEADVRRDRDSSKTLYEFPKQYALTRHAELAVKLTLLELWESRVAGLGSNPAKLPDGFTL